MNEPVSNQNSITPRQAIRKKCLCCMNGQKLEIRLCPSTDCALHPYRLNKKPAIKPTFTPLKAIKAKCYDCSGFSKKEQRCCDFKKCALWPYRLGHNPKRKGIGGNKDNPAFKKNAILRPFLESELINA